MILKCNFNFYFLKKKSAVHVRFFSLSLFLQSTFILVSNIKIVPCRIKMRSEKLKIGKEKSIEKNSCYLITEKYYNLVCQKNRNIVLYHMKKNYMKSSREKKSKKI